MGDSRSAGNEHFDDYERRAAFVGFAEDDVSEVFKPVSLAQSTPTNIVSPSTRTG
jgi:hypothetical protein